MDDLMPAFAVYQQKELKKRKRNREVKTKIMKERPAKKVKESVDVSDTSKKTNSKTKNIKRKKLQKKNKSQSKDSDKLSFNGASHSDEEIPTLIPIIDKLDKSNTLIRENKESKIIKSISSLNSNLNPVTQSLAVFKWILDPIKPRDFFEHYWEKDVLHIERSDRDYFRDFFSSSKLDNILREYPLHFTRNVDVVVYENDKKEVLNPEGRAVASQLWDYYSNGCSIRVLNPQTYDQHVHFVIANLQEYFGTMVGTNVYLTPPASQGFAPHFDDIEAFIIQLEGSKHWKLYKPKDEDVLTRESSINFKAKDLDTPFMEVTLNAGDVLYFPRGTIHEGHTFEENHSLHITVSVYQHTAYVDLMEHILPQALSKAAANNIEFRKGLPLHYLKQLGLVNRNEDSNKRKMIINKIKSLVNTLVDYIDVDSAADRLGKKFMHDAMPPLYSNEEAQHSSKYDGDYMKNGKVYNRFEISSDVSVRLLRYYVVRVVKEEDSYKLYYCTENAKSYHGEEEQWLEIDSALVIGIEVLQKKYPEFISVEDIPIQDEQAKLQLVSDLWERGLLVTESPLLNISSDVDSENSSIGSDDLEEIIESYSE
ncbi:bifunctional lysine-specific demethylase and histidyl-hydroxylase NO66 [Rhynchophorus ferrugineus]|uniref:bifunctional lysine-specific demethylase and histidyl-hydroxylase NO66 n=1 Tax=Rhynchophorus ferrugineus TaxID=354439 RepID=UPI003FCDFAF2